MCERQVAVLARRELEVGQPLELGLLVGRHVQPLAVGAEGGAAVGHLLGAALRGDERLLARGDVDEPEVALVDRDRLEHHELLVVGRPVGSEPAAALHLEHHPRGGRVLRVHHVDVAVGSVAPGRAEGHAVALVRPGPEAVLRAAAGRELGKGAARDVEPVDLPELVAALVLGEDDVVRRAARPAGVADAVRKERELAARAEREAHLVELVRVAEARGDQHLALRRVPGREARRAELGVAAHRVGDLGRDLRETVGYQVVGRLDDGLGGAGRRGLRVYRNRHGQAQQARERSDWNAAWTEAHGISSVGF